LKTCPGRGRLEQLLENRLVDTERDELEQHVEGCAACQQRLDELSGPMQGGNTMARAVTVQGANGSQTVVDLRFHVIRQRRPERPRD
jgi:hypothetical protein